MSHRQVESRRGPQRGWPALLAVVALVATTVGVKLTRADAQGRAVTWHTVWSDEFTGPADTPPATANWLTDTGHGYPNGATGWGNNEVESYTADPANVGLDGAGNLRIAASRDAAGTWTSGRLETARTDFAPTPGGSLKIEARLQLPAGGQGYWPAFWMLGADLRSHKVSWPTAGEIDVMENVNNATDVHGTLHCGVAPGGPCHEKTGRSATRSLGVPAGQAGMHTYAVVWETAPQRLIWSVDGVPYFQLTPKDLGQATWDATFGHGYFLLLNLAVGGDWPGYPNQGTVPGASMLVDWVRVSQII